MKTDQSKSEPAANKSASGGRPAPACSALVTRYPTGIFGIAFAGCMFWKTCWKESEVHEELAALKLPKRHVQWEERYYDRRYDINDPRCYRTRKFIPQNATAQLPPRSGPNSDKDASGG